MHLWWLLHLSIWLLNLRNLTKIILWHHLMRSPILWYRIIAISSLLLRWLLRRRIHLWDHWRHAHRILLLSITIPVGLRVWLVPISLGSVVHFNSASQYLLSLHLLKSAFRFLFHVEFNESVALGHPGDWVADDLGLKDTGVHLLESLHQQDVVHARIQVANVDLVAFGGSLLLLSIGCPRRLRCELRLSRHLTSCSSCHSSTV
jgi:hypothetical protein